MRDGVIISLGVSFALHFALVVTGMIKLPQPVKPAGEQMVVLPLEIMKISDSTNVAAATMKIPKAPDPKAMEETAKAASSAATAPAPQPEAEIMPGTTPTPNPKPSPTPTTTAKKDASAEKKKDDYNDVLNSVLQSAAKAKPAQRSVTSSGSINNVDNVNRQGMGDNKTNTATFAAYFSSQLKQKCWGDQDDLPDAKRLRATFRVKFRPDGRLNGEAEFVDPVRIPAADAPMKIFMTRALRALQQCQPYTIPPEYNQQGQPAIVLEFTP